MADSGKTTAIDPKTLEPRFGSSYPPAFKGPCENREKRVVGDALGLTHFGVNLVTLAPGSWSAQRHWHTGEDEFVMILEGEATLVTDAGEQLLGPGMVAGFPAGREDGHHLVNKSGAPVVYLEIGDRNPNDEAFYPDVDLQLIAKPGGGRHFTDKSGKPLG